MFCTGNREDTPYWKTVKHDMDIPPGLKENLAVWRHTMPDALDLKTSTFFTPTSYRSALMGKRFYKGRKYTQVAPLGEAEWGQYLKLRRDRTQGLMNILPDHYELLQQIRGEAPSASMSFSLNTNALTGGGL